MFDLHRQIAPQPGSLLARPRLNATTGASGSLRCRAECGANGMVPVHQVALLATGPDAKDVALATIFGPARVVSISPELVVLPPDAGRIPR